MRGRFNAIQKSMLQWDDMHPYSAIHVVQLAAALDAGRVRACLEQTLARRGVGTLRVDRKHWAYQYEEGPIRCEILTLEGGADPRAALVAEMERQLNARFDSTGPFCPFRFLIVPADPGFFLGIVYFHPAADAEAIVYLLKEIVQVYLRGGPAPGSNGGVPELYPESRARLLTRHPGVVARKLLGMPGQMRDLRHSHRASHHLSDAMTNGYVFFSLPPGDLDAVTRAAKTWSTTVNDVFLALLIQSLSLGPGARQRGGKRHQLSLGCIVNLRKELGDEVRGAFGTFLGSFTITHAVPEKIPLRQLAVDIRQQTARIKRHRLYLGTPLELALGRFFLKLFSPARRKKFYAKNYPLYGGITNMNLNSLWEQKSGQEPLDYFRGVSTGPITPLALSVSTVADRVNIGLSYRTSAFTRKDIEELVGRFRERLLETREAP